MRAQHRCIHTKHGHISLREREREVAVSNRQIIHIDSVFSNSLVYSICENTHAVYKGNLSSLYECYLQTFAVLQMVAGRFINVYSTNDWILGVTFRARYVHSIWSSPLPCTLVIWWSLCCSLLTQGLGGIQAVDVPGIENVTAVIYFSSSPFSICRFVDICGLSLLWFTGWCYSLDRRALLISWSCRADRGATWDWCLLSCF